MYDNRRFSLARYSINQETAVIEIAETFSEVLGAVAGAAIPVEHREKYAENIQGSARGTISVVTAFSAASDLLAAVSMSADVVLRGSFVDNLQAAAAGRKNIPDTLVSADELRGTLYASKNIPEALEGEEALSAAVEGSKNVPGPLYVSEVLTSVLSATSQTTETATFQLTIPPGGELRIDSEIYTVLLNGENALHTQAGDWVHISRELLRLIIESATGGDLRGQLIYTERYL